MISRTGIGEWGGGACLRSPGGPMWLPHTPGTSLGYLGHWLWWFCASRAAQMYFLTISTLLSEVNFLVFASGLPQTRPQ